MRLLNTPADMPPGILPTRDILDRLAAAQLAQPGVPFSVGQILAITGSPPAYPSGLPRFASNGGLS